MAITFFGSASTPADNGTYSTSPAVITPVASMQMGDLVYLVACSANTSGDMSISEAGGQTWTRSTGTDPQVSPAGRHRTRTFWCVFNGTWTANPSVTMAGTANNIVRMLVFRPNGGTAGSWVTDGTPLLGTYTAPADPYQVTITGDTVSSNTVTIATWTSADDNTWTPVDGGTGSFVAVSSPNQVRNTVGAYDQSVANAYWITAAGGSTGTVMAAQETTPGDAGTRYRQSFREVTIHSAVGTSAAVANTPTTTKASRIFSLSSLTNGCVVQSSATANGTPLKFLSGSSAAATTATANALNEDRVDAFYSWLVGSPAIGGVAGPKVSEHCHIVEVSSYVVGGTSAAFNIEERTTPESAGTDVLSSDQTADADGATTSTINNSEIAADNTLWLDISAVTGEVSQLSVTAHYYTRVARFVEAAASCVASTAASALAAVDYAARAVASAVAAAAARAVSTLVLVGTCAAATTATAGASGIALVDVAGTSAAVTTATASPSLLNKHFGFYNWVVSNPTTGGIAGPKVAQDCYIDEVSSYVTAATSATFNVEERTTPESAGTNLLSSDQVADVDGTTTSTIANDYLTADNTLWLDISATSGTPGTLSVTVAYHYYLVAPAINPRGTSAAASAATAKASVLKPVRGTSAAVTTATASTEAFTGAVQGFYNWSITNPAVGRVAGPRLVEDILITEVSGYIVGGTQLSFNIEERDDPSVVGPQILADDLDVTTAGEGTTTFSDETIEAEEYLFLYIRNIRGTPTQLSVTIHWTPTPMARATCRASTTATASAYTETRVSGSSHSVFNCFGDFVRSRFVTASASADGAATAGARVTVDISAEASSAAETTATANAQVEVAGFTASSAAETAATASAVRDRYVVASSAAETTATANAEFVTEGVRGTSAAVTTATATADFKNKARGTSAAVTTATANVYITTPIVASSAAVASTTAKLTYTLGGLKGTSASASSATAAAQTYGPAQLWVKINGSWRMIANGLF